MTASNGAGKKPDHEKDCVICGAPLVYFPEERMMECRICHKVLPTNAACENGHFVCDACHAGGGAAILDWLQSSDEKDPYALLHAVFRIEGVHLHGPEHHSIVPCVLITAFRNCGGELDYDRCMQEAWKRGKKVPGGACGFFGACGAAVGAGIFASVVGGATPLEGDKWALAQRLTAACLNAIADHGGPRCCKRTTRLAVACAAEFSEKVFGVAMPVGKAVCGYWAQNTECIRERCPFFPKKDAE